MFNVAVCDDELENHTLLKQLFLHLAASTPYVFNIKYFNSGEDLIQYYKENEARPFHILILDIEMNGMNGLETAKLIRSLPDREVQIIFFTSYQEYMIDSFDVQTFHYLIKPVPYDLFKSKILKLCSYILSSTNRYVPFKTKEELLIVRSSEVIAIVKAKHSIAQKQLDVIMTQQRITCTGTLSEYLTSPGFPFILVHRSVIINLEHVHKVSSNSIIMSNQEELPIGRSYAKNVKDIIARYFVAQFSERG